MCVCVCVCVCVCLFVCVCACVCVCVCACVRGMTARGGGGRVYRVAFKSVFHACLLARVSAERAAGRNVIIAGDFNVIAARADTSDPAAREARGDGAPLEEHSGPVWMAALGSAGFVDSYRMHHPAVLACGSEAPPAVTFWSAATSARTTNYGSRLDYIVVRACRPAWVRVCSVCVCVCLAAPCSRVHACLCLRPHR